MNTNVRGFVRAYPFFFVVLSILLSNVYQLNSLLFLVLLMFVSSVINSEITKPIVLKLLKSFKLENIALRPKGAKNCSHFIDENNPKIPSNTFGMPSGHSLEAMLISVFLIMYVNKNHKNGLKKDILIISILLIGLGVCISRVILGCHTVLQIIIGGLLGSVIGYYGFIYWVKIDKILNKDKDI